MTAALIPDPEAIRSELGEPVGHQPPPTRAAPAPVGGTPLQVGVATLWLSLIVLLPLAAIAWQAVGGGWQAFWLAITSHAALESFKVTLLVSVVVTIINLVFGLATAWVLVRDDFVGKEAIDAMIDLPFALPTRGTEVAATSPLNLGVPTWSDATPSIALNRATSDKILFLSAMPTVIALTRILPL